MKATWFLWTVGALISWGFWGIMTKVALDELSWQLLAIISVLGYLAPIVPLLILARPRSTELSWHNVGKGTALGLVSQVGLLAFYAALEGGQAAIVVPLTALYPAVTLVGAILLLRESVTPRQAVGVVLALAAAFLLAAG